MQIGKLDWIPPGTFPTPIQELKSLSEHLGGPRLFIKRDDLTGLGLGSHLHARGEIDVIGISVASPTAAVTARIGVQLDEAVEYLEVDLRSPDRRSRSSASTSAPGTGSRPTQW